MVYPISGAYSNYTFCVLCASVVNSYKKPPPFQARIQTACDDNFTAGYSPESHLVRGISADVKKGGWLGGSRLSLEGFQ